MGLASCAQDQGGARLDGGPSPEGGAPPSGDCAQLDARFATLRARFEAALATNHAPGGALALVCGTQVRSGGIGVVRLGGAPVTASTRFQLASITKTFTATTAVSLARSGAIDLSAPISRILPALGYGVVTLDQILTHTSGLPTIFPNENFEVLHDWVLDNTNAHLTLWSAPGAVWNYNNDGYAVAGALLEVATGRPFPDLVREHVFTPLGMTHASMLVSEVLAGDFAYGHSGAAGNATVLAPQDSYYGSPIYGPMGGAWASADDMAALARSLLGGSPYPGLLAALREPHTRTGVVPGDFWGYGLEIDDGMRPTVLSHSGSVRGFLAQLEMVPDAGIAAVALVNNDWYFPADITRAGLQAFVDLQEIRPPAPPAANRWPLLTGSYQSLVFGKMDIRMQSSGAGLEAQFIDRGYTAPLAHAFYDNYSVDWRGDPCGTMAPITFWFDGSGPASYVVSVFGVARRN